MEDQILETLDDELGADYYMEFRDFIQEYTLPLSLDEFMRLEMSFYESYKNKERRRNKRSSVSGLRPIIQPA